MKRKAPLAGRELVDEIVRLAEEKKAEKIVILDLRQATTVADWFVICGSDNPAQSRAILDSVTDGLAQKNTLVWRLEGAQEGRWILVDYVDVIVHIMLEEMRDYYDLEHLFEKSVVIEERTSHED